MLESPIETAIRSLGARDPKWRVEIGGPIDAPGWIAGRDFHRAKVGPFHELLSRIGDRLQTADRRTISASFALRFGWYSAMAIVPFAAFGCVPDVGLENISIGFRPDTMFAGTRIHLPRGAALQVAGVAPHPLVQSVPDRAELLAVLRRQLVQQTQPVVEAMYEWSGFPQKGSWGQITSSWASQFVSVYERPGNQSDALPVIEAFFEGSDEIWKMRPLLHPLTLNNVTHLYQRRASCCRYYLLPQGSLCASCPLVSQEERVARNLDWMRRQMR